MTPSEHPDLLTIGEFSRRSNLSIKALRHYDELGLLPPASIDPTNGYRRYGHDQLRVAAHIKLLRGIDLPLVDVGRFLALVAEDPASASASAMLDDHLVRLEEQQAVRRSLVRHLQITLREDADPVYPIRTTHVPAARVASIERHLTIDEADAFLAEAWDAFHEHLAGVAPTLPFTVLLHGVVDDESDGPMEAIIGWPEGVAVPAGVAVRDDGRTLEVDPALAALVGASDGELTVGQLSDAIAELLEVDAAALRADLLPRVRELVFIGMLRLA